MRHTVVHFRHSIIDGEQESLQEIITKAFRDCFVKMENYTMPSSDKIEFDIEHHDFDYMIRCLTSMFVGLGVEVQIEAPFDPCFEFLIG